MVKSTTKKEKKPKTEKKRRKPAAPKKEKVIDKKEETIETEKAGQYLETIGRRKTSVARVRFLTKGEKEFLVNNKPYQNYFPTLELQQIASSSLEKMKYLDRFRILVKVKGGGIHSQAEAVRHGTARALVKFNEDFRKRLRRVGHLTRDPRVRERKKFGLKRARRAPQWQKR